MLEIDEIIQAARDRTGNKKDVAVGEQYVPDEAIIHGIEDAIVELNSAFGQSSARKDVFITAVVGQPLPTPPTPTLTTATGTGTLPAGSYNYVITATRGNGETMPGSPAVSSAVLSATGQIVVAWTSVQGADGYNVYGRVPGAPQKLVNVPASVLTWTDAGIALPGSAIPQQDTTGSNGRYIQDYDVETYVGTDVQEILEVLRSDACLSNSMLQPMQVDPRTGIPFARAAFIDQAYQQDALEEMQAMQRWRKRDEEDWEVVNINGRDVLRVMPPPTQPVVIAVRYLASSDTVSTLPDEARPALEHAACVALLDGVLNRVNSTPAGMDSENARGWKAWLEMVERQRDLYQARYRRALGQRSSE